ncbi:MAG: UDP-N-acetylglucosamine--N-acetylmuramyl-(pentapeptide) pyrophosphoryl-undecaprenol N-acetylglucosamine transferase [Candidatus Paceibacterota bacterium]
MKILLTGGGSAGHFYPLIAIAEEIHKTTDERKLLPADLHYMSTAPYDKKLLFENDITFHKVLAGKRRLYFSLWNYIDMVKMAIGIVMAIIDVFFIFPDVVISKGGYASIPALFAARLFNIPVIIHESDSYPGRANKWASKFARRIAVAWSEAASFFPKEKVAVVGLPVRRDLIRPLSRGAYEYLKLSEKTPTLLIMGGSQGAQKINEAVMDVLPELLSEYQVIHQTGVLHNESVKKTASVILNKNENASRYKPFAYLNPLAMRMSAGVASLVVSRSGSTIFEIAAWGIPSILIPITHSQGDHQRKNAFTYARTGASVVIEEENLTPHVLLSEIKRIISNKAIYDTMSTAAKNFFDDGAATAIAHEALEIGLSHEL